MRELINERDTNNYSFLFLPLSVFRLRDRPDTQAQQTSHKGITLASVPTNGLASQATNMPTAARRRTYCQLT